MPRVDLVILPTEMARHWTPTITALLLMLSLFSPPLTLRVANAQLLDASADLLLFNSGIDSPSEIVANCSCSDPSGADPATNQTNCTSISVGAPENFGYSFKEIAALPRQAELSLTWDRQQNESALCFYVVQIRGITPNMGCNMTNDITIWIDKDYSNVTLTAASFSEANLSLPLLYECHYRLSVSSYPNGSEEFIIDDLYIHHTQKATISVDCHSTYKPENVTYDLDVNWSLVPYDQLTSEAVRMNGYTVSLSSLSHMSIPRLEAELRINGNSHVFEDLEVINPETGELYEVEVKFRCLSRTFGMPLFWRWPLVSMPCGNFGQPIMCRASATPHPPTWLQSVTLLEAAYFPEINTFHVSLSWELPVYPNGEIRNHEIRIGSLPIPPTQDSLETGRTFKQMEVEATKNNLTYDVRVVLGEVYVQMRTRNSFLLYGNWSDPIIIDLLNVTVESNITTEPMEGEPQPTQLPLYAYIVIGIAAALLVVIVIVIVILCVVVIKRHFYIDIDAELVPVRKSLHGPIVRDRGNFTLLNPSHTQIDEWEIAEDEIAVFKDQPLGEGCFGQVFKGMLMGQSLQNRPRGNFRPPIFSLTCQVAVKQLKKNAHGSDRENFFKEMKMMKMVSSADNEMKQFVVNMIGCITVKEPLLLVVEFVRHGDLQRYLRTIKRQVMAKLAREQSEATPYLEPEGAYSELNPSTETYSDLGSLEEKNLLEFARQIAAGMEFLSGLGVIHRDLACRNILIGEHKKLKISDFGMSRFLPKDEVYVPMSHGLLPLRWMAIESIHAREFTTASDVWSYGVVLWELCTMCDFPYKSIPNHELLGYLKHGYRLPRPKNCSAEVFDVMVRCWSEHQQQRPVFPDLRKQFDQFLSVYVQDQYPYIELESGSHYDRLVDMDPLSYGLTRLFGTSCHSSTHNLDTAEEMEEHSGSLKSGSNLSLPQGGPMSANGGRAMHLSPLPRHLANRLSILSDSTPLVRTSTSNQDLRSMSSSMNQLELIGREGIQSLPNQTGHLGSFHSLNEQTFVDVRYVESPTAALSHSSSMTVSSNLSIDRTNEVTSQSDRDLSKTRSGDGNPGRVSPENVDGTQGDDPGNYSNSHNEAKFHPQFL